jgi:hypothetical protein
MNQILFLVLTLAALALMIVQLIRAVRRDGYGTRPPPASHHEEAVVRGVQRSMV